MKRIVLSESQSIKLAKLLKESETQVQQMPVDKKMNKPYFVNPDKVKVVKKFLDNGFTAHDFERVGANGFPEKIKIITMNASNGTPLKPMYKDQVKDLLIDKFQNMFLDKMERDMFMTQVLDDWLNNAISVHGMLTKNMLKEATVTSDMVDERASETNTDPTDKQKEAGNFKMGHVSIKGMQISIENPKGSIRRGTDSNGTSWEVEMKNHYGYFTNTTGNGKDGDAVDVFIGPHPDDFDKVFVVDQKVDGKFDESKVMIGFYSKQEALEAYRSNYNADWQGFWRITGVTLRVFKKWLYRDHKQRKPFFDYVTIKKQRLAEGVVNEEEYNEVKFVGRMFDEKAAVEVCEELKADGIEAYNNGNAVYVMVERDMLSPYYVDEVVEYAENKIRQYMQTHSDSMEPAQSLAEGDIHPLDVYNNVKSNPDPGMGRPKQAPPVENWVVVKGKKNKMNLRNLETGDLLSDMWFDWIGNMVHGYALVMSRARGYNIISEKGELVLPEWHEDIQEADDEGYYTLIDGNERKKIKP